MNGHCVKALMLWAVLTAGCSSGQIEETEQLKPMPDALPGVYGGDFPCSNCSAIRATLWLRSDYRFFLRQTYAGGESTSEDSAYAIGKWHWDEHEGEIVLTGKGPERRFVPLDERRLELHTAFSNVPYELTRLDESPPFTDEVRLDGESTVIKGGATFTECVSGLKLAVAPAHGFKDLRRRVRELSSGGKAVLATIEGHLAQVRSSDGRVEVLVVDRVIGLKPGTGC